MSHLSTSSNSTDNHPKISITSPEKSPELDHLTETVQAKIPDIFKANISSQMGELLWRLPAFESLISRNHRIFGVEIYHFLTSRWYETKTTSKNEQQKYREKVTEFIKRWESLGAHIDTDVFVETEIVSWAPRWNTTFKYYQTFTESAWNQYIDKLPELYGMIAREFGDNSGERISAKFPAFLSGYMEKCDNLVIYCRNQDNLPRIQKMVEQWILRYSLPAVNRPFYRSAFWIDTAPAHWQDKTSFSDLCAILSIEYAKKYESWYKKQTGKTLTEREYNILVLGQACMMASSEPKELKAVTKR